MNQTIQALCGFSVLLNALLLLFSVWMILKRGGLPYLAMRVTLLKKLGIQSDQATSFNFPYYDHRQSQLELLSIHASDIVFWATALLMKGNGQSYATIQRLRIGVFLATRRSAFCLAAQSFSRSQCAFGAENRWMHDRLGAPKAITATAHKIARIFNHLGTSKEADVNAGAAYEDQQYRQQALNNLKRQTQPPGFDWIPQPTIEEVS